jgi:hypothetical protein
MRISTEKEINKEIDGVRATFIAQLKAGAEQISVSMPHTLYLTDEQSLLFDAATIKSEQYRNKIDQPISRLIRKISERTILSDIGSHVSFIDLGPGYPSKSLAMIDSLSSQGTQVTYHAVDISPFFLERAVSAAQQRNILAHSLHRRFEDIGPILDAELAPKTPRIIFIGLTFCNFDPHDICVILRSITRPGDYCLVCSQSAEGLAPASILAPYTTEAVQNFSREPLRIIGIPEDRLKYTPELRGDYIDICFTITAPFDFSGATVPEGKKISTARSYRINYEKTLKTLGDYFSVRDTETESESGISIFSLQGKSGLDQV